MSAHSILGHASELNARDSVYLRWDVGDRAGTWTITTDASPTSHDFDLYGRDDRGSGWDDQDRSGDGDESITVDVLAGGHIVLRVQNYDGGAPTDLTLSIEAPAAVDPPVSDPTDTPTADGYCHSYGDHHSDADGYTDGHADSDGNADRHADSDCDAD